MKLAISLVDDWVIFITFLVNSDEISFVFNPFTLNVLNKLLIQSFISFSIYGTLPAKSFIWLANWGEIITIIAIIMPITTKYAIIDDANLGILFLDIFIIFFIKGSINQAIINPINKGEITDNISPSILNILYSMNNLLNNINKTIIPIKYKTFNTSFDLLITLFRFLLSKFSFSIFFSILSPTSIILYFYWWYYVYY